MNHLDFSIYYWPVIVINTEKMLDFSVNLHIYNIFRLVFIVNKCYKKRACEAFISFLNISLFFRQLPPNSDYRENLLLFRQWIVRRYLARYTI